MAASSNVPSSNRFADTIAFSDSGDRRSSADLQPPLQIIEGSSPNLAHQTRELLRIRLRTASLLLFAGFLVFLILRVFSESRLDVLRCRAHLPLHVLATLVTGMVGIRLCTGCQVLRRNLRVAELLVFGSSALFFVSHSYLELLASAKLGYVATITGPWQLLIFTYALFVPNTWQRALTVIGPLAALPVIVLFVVRLTSADLADIVSTDPAYQNALLEAFLAMALCATIAVWGVRTIGSLRHEAFEARQLGQYRLKRLIGSGGMGEVYVAEHVLLKRPCAIKLIRQENAGDRRALARFEREVRATARLSHWNTVDIYDYGRAQDGTFYYVMEYLLGMNLDDLVSQYGPIPAGRVVYLLRQTCDALGEAHAVGMVHRDIKPANIYAAKRGRAYDVAKLLDFGLVRQTRQSADVMLTAEHTITGSPRFMSPEQATGDQVDARSDIYSLGAVAYLLLTGQPPFEGDQPIQVIIAHANQPPVPPSRWNPGIPADLEDVVLKCLEKNPDDRFQSADELHGALDSCSCREDWNGSLAAAWWSCHGCPQKKQLDAAVMAGHVSALEASGVAGETDGADSTGVPGPPTLAASSVESPAI